MASKTYEVAWKNPTQGTSGRKVYPASSLGSALHGMRHHMDVERGGVKHEVIEIRIERVS